MANLSMIEKMKLEQMFKMSSGYVLDFSNNSFRDFILSTVKKDVYDPKYASSGDSKARRFRSFWEMEADETVGATIEQMLVFHEAKIKLNPHEQQTFDQTLYSESLKIAKRLQNGNTSIAVDHEDQFLQKEVDEIAITDLGLDSEITLVLQARITELKKCLKANASLSSVFLCGSILEGVLLGLGKKNMKDFNLASCSPKTKDTGVAKPYHEWTLNNFIEVAHELKFLGLDVKRYSHELRDFRNFIHPHEQVKLKFNPDLHTAKISWQVLKAALHDIHEKIN